MNISEFQTSFPVGTVISYHCFPGFKLEGSEYLECLHNLIWSSSPPRCLALEGNVSPCFAAGSWVIEADVSLGDLSVTVTVFCFLSTRGPS